MATWVDRGRQRVVVDGNGKITSRMRLISPPGDCEFDGSDTGATDPPGVEVIVAAYPNNIYTFDYITVAYCETAMELIIG